MAKAEKFVPEVEARVKLDLSMAEARCLKFVLGKDCGYTEEMAAIFDALYAIIPEVPDEFIFEPTDYYRVENAPKS